MGIKYQNTISPPKYVSVSAYEYVSVWVCMYYECVYACTCAYVNMYIVTKMAAVCLLLRRLA